MHREIQLSSREMRMEYSAISLIQQPGVQTMYVADSDWRFPSQKKILAAT